MGCIECIGSIVNWISYFVLLLFLYLVFVIAHDLVMDYVIHEFQARDVCECLWTKNGVERCGASERCTGTLAWLLESMRSIWSYREDGGTVEGVVIVKTKIQLHSFPTKRNSPSAIHQFYKPRVLPVSHYYSLLFHDGDVIRAER